MIRYTWMALMAVIALCAGGAQLDRQSRRDTIWAPLVPSMFRNFALERQVITTVRSAEPATALQSARLLVERSPIPSTHISLLAIAEARNGHNEKAAFLLQKAAQRGWRDSLAQQAMLNIASNAGDMAESSRRLAALWGIRETQMPLIPATAQILDQPEGRKAMATVLANGGSWVRAYLTAGPELPPQHFAETVAMAATNGARFDCNILHKLEDVYAARRLVNETAMIAEAKKTCRNRKSKA